MKLILDTNIFVSSLAFDSLIERLHLYILSQDKFQLYFSASTFRELGSQINGSKFDKLLSKSRRKLSLEHSARFLDEVQQSAVFMASIESSLSVCRDPKDNMFLELAQTIHADYLITGNTDLLVLKQFETTKILKPSEFIAELHLNL